MIHHRKVDVHDYLLNRIIRIRVAIWLYARPNKSNLAFLGRSWPWNFWFGILEQQPV